MAILEPVGVQRHNVHHFKGLIKLNLDSEAQGHGKTFTFYQTLLKNLFYKGKEQSYKELVLGCITEECMKKAGELGFLV